MHRGGSASTCAHLHRFSPLEILVLREADVELEGHLLMSRECGRGLRVPPVARPASQGPLPPAARRRRCTSICTCYSAGAACMLPVPRCRPPPARFPGAMAEIPSAGKRKQSLRLEKLPSFRINTSLPPPFLLPQTYSAPCHRNYSQMSIAAPSLGLLPTKMRAALLLGLVIGQAACGDSGGQVESHADEARQRIQQWRLKRREGSGGQQPGCAADSAATPLAAWRCRQSRQVRKVFRRMTHRCDTSLHRCTRAQRSGRDMNKVQWFVSLLWYGRQPSKQIRVWRSAATSRSTHPSPTTTTTTR